MRPSGSCGGSLIALNKAQSFAFKTGLNIGPSAFVAALEYVANVQCTVIGYIRSLLCVSICIAP